MNNPPKRLATSYSLALIGILLAFTITIDMLTQFLYELEIGFFMVILITTFLSTSLSALFTNILGLLKVISTFSAIFFIPYWISLNIIWLVVFLMRKQIVKHWWIILIIAPILSCLLEASNMLFELAITQSWEKAKVLYLSRVIRNDVLFTAYLILPILITPLIWELFANLKIRMPFVFNKDFLNSSKDKIAFNKYNKNNIKDLSPNSVRTWKLTFGIETGLVAVVFSFLPFFIYHLVGVKGLSLILLIPLGMFLFTPMWRKLKAVIGNHSTIKITSIGLFLMLTLLITWGLQKGVNNFVPTLALLLFFTGSFVAGIVPFTMEILRSHGKNFNKKYRFELIQIIFSLIMIPIPYILFLFIKDEKIMFYSLIGLFSTIGLLLTCLINFNRKTQIEEVTFYTQPDDMANLKAHKKYFLFIFSNSFFYALGEAFTYTAIAFIYILAKNMHWPLSELIVVGLLVCGFLIRKVGALIVVNLKISENKILKWNIISYALVVTGLVVLITGAMVMLFIPEYWYIYFTGFLINEILLGVGLAIMSKTKKNTLTLINGRHNNLAMIFDHVLGRGLYSLLIGFIITMIFAFVLITNLMIVIVVGVLIILAILALVFSVIAQKPSRLEKIKTFH
ncbi:hypothetical protein [Spiroplasma alleghenense]|uniref:MFS transporter n=1 Tax=Spiroplasma alleghenense TaxID=216931 RepID=A0A345Z3Q0_9MOLU|nr:hypothetical protein [Spiroplasma alleghenense]AXK51229.1 hypothetical protein SALLE_v1c05550 [Spiroplasma alleghenense]